MRKNIQIVLYLGFITLVSGILLNTIHQYTQPRIMQRKEQEQNAALMKVLPQASKFVGMDKDLPDSKQSVFKAFKGRKIVGYVFKSSPKGYGGNIDMLVGISNGLISGVVILSHTETPGLGALATDVNNMKGHDCSFLGQFVKKAISDQFIAKQDVIAITGATITSAAIANGIKEAIRKYKSL